MRNIHLFLLCVVCFSLTTAGFAASPPWTEILGPRQGSIPGPIGFKPQWRGDLTAAMAEARQLNRPLFVTMRCLPCKQCSEFDKEVLEGGADLDPILTQFITVRLTDARAIDLRYFPIEGFQDLDLSWWGWFLSPQGQVYGVYGGKDHVSDATRISKASLIRTLNEILKYHYDPRRAKWNLDGPMPELMGLRSPTQLPGYSTWKKNINPKAMEHQGQTCLHCHMVNDILRTPAIEAKLFDKERDTQVWPLPENVGITVERDHGLLVKEVTPDSPAARVGIKPGDLLGAASGRLLFSQADFRGALHRGPKGAGTIDVVWSRKGSPMTGTLQVADNWRKTVLDWRMSISQGVIGAGPAFFPLALKDEKRKQLGLEGKMAVSPYFGSNTNSPAYAAGLRNNFVVTAVNGKSPDVSGRGFLVWFCMTFEPGDTAVFSYRNEKGQPGTATLKLNPRH